MSPLFAWQPFDTANTSLCFTVIPRDTGKWLQSHQANSKQTYDVASSSPPSFALATKATSPVFLPYQSFILCGVHHVSRRYTQQTDRFLAGHASSLCTQEAQAESARVSLFHLSGLLI